MTLVDRALATVGLARALPAPSSRVPNVPREQYGAPRPNAEYLRGGRGMVFSGPRPALREARDDVARAWDHVTARMIDLVQNSGFISGMVDQCVADTVGEGLRLRCMPENELFGMSNEDAIVWRKLVEARWDLWSNSPLECDIEGRRTIGQMQAAAFKHWIATGEILAELVWRERPWSLSGTKVRLLSSMRIVNRTDKFTRVFQGVRCNADGMAVSFLTRQEDTIIGINIEREVQARDRFGRPKVIHVFVGEPGTTRGITCLVPVLKVAKQFDQLSDATLMAAIIQTVFAAAITSQAPTQDALAALMTPEEQAKLRTQGLSPFDAWFEMQTGWHEGHPIDVGTAGRVAHMFPGEDFKFLSPNQPQAAYKDFSLHLLREMARCLGMTYESATGDYEGATYSSVRMAVNAIFSIVKARRRFIVSPFCQPIYEAWLEEEIERGLIPFPGGIVGFLANRAAACRARWAGDPKPQADDLKAAKSAEVYRNMGVVSDQMIANDLGVDIEDVYADREKETKLREKYGLPPNQYPQSLSTTEQIEAQPDEPKEPADGNSDA